MLARWPLLALAISAGAAYAAYPYVTLDRLGEAIHNADTVTLEALVDWPAVREGIKEDVCDLGAGDPSPGDPSPIRDTALPPFGMSFMRGIQSGAIDRAVTPMALLAVAAGTPANPPAHGPDGASLHVEWAFFAGPRTFAIRLQSPHRPESIDLEMELRHGVWRVNRIWLPAALLISGSRT